MKNKVVSYFLIAVFLLMQPACGKDTFAKTFEGSKDFGALTDKAVDTIRLFYEKQAITREKKNKLAGGLLKIAKGGLRGHEILFELYERFQTPGKVPAGEWQTVVRFFDDELLNPFLLFLEEVANLNPDVSDSIRFYVSRIRDVIKILAAAIGRRAATEETIARAETRMKSARPAQVRNPNAQVIIDGVIAFASDAAAQIIETSATVEEKISLGRGNFKRAIQNAERLLDEGGV